MPPPSKKNTSVYLPATAPGPTHLLSRRQPRRQRAACWIQFRWYEPLKNTGQIHTWLLRPGKSLLSLPSAQSAMEQALTHSSPLLAQHSIPPICAEHQHSALPLMCFKEAL
ncbi:hypothetical protein JZ751_002821 [Albula glossodonta]|uniref:Uncharacterized protein n=1 Tax=Albula glossodonta TaxID=121402 RepID=A0A8T2N952_9TELE|nr:hypothetical protein JZ751_002821 [Albula glossodonta]